MQYSVLVPLAKSQTGDKDWLDQGLQSKNLDPRQGFGDLTHKLQEWSQLQQGRDPPGLLPEQGLGARKKIPEAKLVFTCLLRFRYLQY